VMQIWCKIIDMRSKHVRVVCVVRSSPCESAQQLTIGSVSECVCMYVCAYVPTHTSIVCRFICTDKPITQSAHQLVGEWVC
jgi:hypothetical protein